MPATTFDTLKTAEDLKAAGIEDSHARAIAGAMREAVTTGDLATKADLRSIKEALSGEIARLETRLTWRFLGGLGLLFALLKLFP